MVRVSKENLYIAPEDTKCEISFKWACTINGRQVNTKGDISIVVNSNEVETFREAPGTITVDVREYLKDGSNTVTVKIQDGYGTKKQLGFSVEIVKLTLLTSGYTQNSVVELKQLYEQEKPGIAINITALGEVKKQLHMLIDGEEYEGSLPEFDAGRQNDTIYIPLPGTKEAPWHGSQLIELYTSHTFETSGKTLYSNSVFYDVIWYDNQTPNNNAIIASTFVQNRGKQYETLRIPYYLFKPGYETYYVKCTVKNQIKNEDTGELEYVITEDLEPQKKTVGEQLEWITNSKYAGDAIFTIEVGRMVEIEKEPENKGEESGEINTIEEETGENESQEEKIEYKFVPEDRKEFLLTLEEQAKPDIPRVANFMPFEFVASKIDNEASDRNVWEAYLESHFGWKEPLKANFNNSFDWKSNGWELRDGRHALKISNGAELEIPLSIFNLSEKYPDLVSFYEENMGVTIEIDLSFDEVSDSEADFFTCFDEDKGSGIKISPSRALLSNGEKTTKVQYASSESKNYNNSMRFSFVINPRQDRYIPQRPFEIEKGQEPVYKDTLGSMFIYINGVGASANEYSAESFAHTKFPTFKSTGCAVHLHSFRMYRRSLLPNEILRNWIYDMNINDQINAYNENWIYNAGGETILYEKVKEKIPCMIITGKQMPTYKGHKLDVSIKFEGTEDELYDFELPLAQIDVQGTSSQYYPVKNWKFKAKDDFEMTKTGEKVSKYALADDQIPAKVFCLKADYMETSSTHNTSTANLANSMYDNKDYGKTPPQREDKEGKTRTTIYGRPIAVFYYNPERDELTFGGKYNFNYDKDAEEVFGFTFEKEDDQKKYEVIDCVEFRDNSTPMCQFTEPFSIELQENLSEAQLKEYDDYSIIEGTNSAEAWGNAFEFRYHYHREAGTQHYSYFEAAADWVYSRNSEGFTGDKLAEEYVVETGNAKFLYTNESKIETFSDGVNTRKALNLEGMSAEEADYKVQTYFIQKIYKKSLNSITGKDELTETETIINEKEAYVRDTGDNAWNAVKDQYDKESYSREEGQKAWNKFVEDYIAENGEAAWDEIKDKYNEAEYIKTSGEKAWDKLVTSYREQPWNELIQTPSSEDSETKTVTNLYNALFWDEEKGAEVYIFDRDTRNYRLTRFKNELPEHFNEHYCLMYFLLMELLAMIDSGTKNMFWATWGERHEKHPVLQVSKEERDYNVIWYPIFYDMDSILGLNNVGKMNIPYSVDFESRFDEFANAEDTGKCFNGADNVFWNNFKEAYKTELNLLFNEKVADNTFSLSKLLNQYEGHSENFPASIYNEDGKLKIIDKYFEGYYEATPEEIANDKISLVPKFPDWMYVYQGDRYYYRRYWLPNRFNYMLSKNFSGSYARDFISMRLYDPNKGITDPSKKVHTDYDFYITTWKDQYTTVRYGSRAVSVKCPAGKETKITSPNSSYNDTETGVYGASNLKTIGSMSAKYLTTLDLSSAINLLEIDLGNSDSKYENTGLKTVTFGANDMLRKVNIENCRGLAGNLNVQSCKNITEINARGTNITGVDFSKDSHIVETLYLPSSTQQLVLNNQLKLANFELPKAGDKLDAEGNKIGEYYNLNKLVVKNTPNVHTKALVEGSMDTLKILHLTNIDWTGIHSLVNDNLLFDIKRKAEREEDKLCQENGKDPPYISGTCYVNSIQDYLEDELNVFFNGVSLEELNKGDLILDKNNPQKCQRRFKLLGTTVKTYLLKFLNKEEGVGDPTKEEDIIDVGLDRHHRVTGDPALIIENLIPTKAPEWDRTYDFVGWNGKYYSEEDEKWYDIYGEDRVTKKIFNDKELDDTPVLNDMVFYPVFKAIPKTFTFTFEPDNGEEQTENKKVKIDNLNDAEIIDGKPTIILISGDFVDEFGDKNNRTYEQYTARAKAPKIQDNEEAYSTHAWRYTKWKLPGTNKIISEDSDFEILDIQTDIKEQFASEETQVRKFDYIVQISDKTLDRKYFITFKDYNGNIGEIYNQTVYYEGQSITIPDANSIYLKKPSDAEFEYEFRGWILNNTQLSKPETPDRVANIQDLNARFFDETIVKQFYFPKEEEKTHPNYWIRDYFNIENNYKIVLRPVYRYRKQEYQIYFHFINGGLENNAETYSHNYHPQKDRIDEITGLSYQGGLHFGETIEIPDFNTAIKEFGIKGYEFIGWKANESDPNTVQYLVTPQTMVTQNTKFKTEYFAAFRKIKYKITFNYYTTDLNNKQMGYYNSDEQDYDYGTILTPPIEKGQVHESHLAQYTFDDWDKTVVQVTYSETYTAKYKTPNYKYHITFNDTTKNGIPETKYYYLNQSVSVLKPSTVLTDYSDRQVRFSYWQSSNGYTINYNYNAGTFDVITLNQDTISALFGQNNYEVVFNPITTTYTKYFLTLYNSGGKNIIDGFNRKTYYKGETINGIPNSGASLNKETDDYGTYSFIGWTNKNDNELTGTTVLSNVTNTTVDALFGSKTELILKPKYNLTYTQYTVTFKYIKGGLPGGLSGESIGYTKTIPKTFKWGDTITAPTSPSITGYTFKGEWRTAGTIVTNGVITKQGEEVKIGSIIIDNSTKNNPTYYMHWDIQKFDVTFKWKKAKEGGNELWSAADSKTYTYKQLIYGSSVSAPTFEDETMFGPQTNKDKICGYSIWTYTVNGTSQEVWDMQPVQGNTTYEMVYTENYRPYTAYYHAGRKVEPVTIYYNDSYSKVNSMSYYRPGWYRRGHSELNDNFKKGDRYFAISDVQLMSSSESIVTGDIHLYASLEYLGYTSLSWETDGVLGEHDGYNDLNGPSYTNKVNNFTTQTTWNNCCRLIDISNVVTKDVQSITANFTCSVDSAGSGSSLHSTRAIFSVVKNKEELPNHNATYELTSKNTNYNCNLTLSADNNNSLLWIGGYSDYGECVSKHKKYYLGSYENLLSMPKFTFSDISFDVYYFTGETCVL